MKTQSETTHTPTPWELCAESGEGFILQMESSEGMVGREIKLPFKMPAVYAGESSEDYANAAFIVRAVNSHEELLKLAKRALDYLELLPVTNTGSVENELFGDLANAIAKAEGK